MNFLRYEETFEFRFLYRETSGALNGRVYIFVETFTALCVLPTKFAMQGLYGRLHGFRKSYRKVSGASFRCFLWSDYLKNVILACFIAIVLYTFKFWSFDDRELSHSVVTVLYTNCEQVHQVVEMGRRNHFNVIKKQTNYKYQLSWTHFSFYMWPFTLRHWMHA